MRRATPVASPHLTARWSTSPWQSPAPAAAEILDGATVAAAIGTGFGMTWEVIAGTAQSLWLFATNVGGCRRCHQFNTDAEAPVRFMSPVSQAELTGHVVESGVAMSLRWFAILSCAIGAINLAAAAARRRTRHRRRRRRETGADRST
ncbi:MAG: hypothetical protein R2710_11810 [Acidimicrobiales bacterium]